MSAYSVLWTEVAERDLREIIAFIAGDTVQNALHVLEKIKDRVAELNTFPERGRVVPELHSCGIFIENSRKTLPFRAGMDSVATASGLF